MAQHLCTACGQSLHTSCYRDDAKSCPHCSVRAGRHVFYAEQAFGERRPRGGAAIIQSWCRSCRRDSIAPPPAFVCGAVTSMRPLRLDDAAAVKTG